MSIWLIFGLQVLFILEVLALLGVYTLAFYGAPTAPEAGVEKNFWFLTHPGREEG